MSLEILFYFNQFMNSIFFKKLKCIMYEQRYSEEILFKSIKNIRGVKLFSRGNTH